MKIIRGTLKLALILYVCAALSGVYVLSASARITPLADDDETMLITIEKGDTLWDLCQEHLKDPLRWRELSKYNDFTNPHLIYPGEKLRIPIAMVKEIVEITEQEQSDLQKQIDDLSTSLSEFEGTQAKLIGELANLNKILGDLKTQLSNTQETTKDHKNAIAGLEDAQKKAIAGLEDAQKKAAKEFEQHVHDQAEQTAERIESVKNELKATDEHIAALQADVKTLLTQIETSQKAINEAVMILKNAEGVHEEPSTAKRTLVFLTTVAAGIGWFALNAIGGRSGE